MASTQWAVGSDWGYRGLDEETSGQGSKFNHMYIECRRSLLTDCQSLGGVQTVGSNQKGKTSGNWPTQFLMGGGGGGGRQAGLISLCATVGWKDGTME